MRSEEIYDPSLGNQLESIHLPDRSRYGRTLLAFPSGATGADLSMCTYEIHILMANRVDVSPFKYSGNEFIFTPNVKASWSFDTPIRQIVSCPPGNPSARKPNFTFDIVVELN